MEETGFEVVRDGRLNISPTYKVIGNLTSAGLNVPLDRAIVEIEALSEMMDERNSAYQRIALGLGWRTWDVNAKNEEHELLETNIKAENKRQGKIKAIITREENKATEKELIGQLDPVNLIIFQNEKKGMSIKQRIEFLEQLVNE